MRRTFHNTALSPLFVHLFALLLAVCVMTPAADAQTITSELRGTVTDATGAVLKGASVEVDGPTGQRDTLSDDHGFFRLSILPPGTYTVTVRRDGFQPVVLDEVTLALDRTITLDVELVVGQTEQVTVRGDAPVADRSRSSLSSVVSPRTIDLIPVNGRNYLDLIRLTPGVVENPRAGATASTALDTTGAILGERAGNISFLTDGLWNNDTFTGGVLQNLTQDTIEQFEVIATGYAAEFGQGSGGVVNVITKSGTNQVSGSGFSFIRNDAFDASNVEGEDAPELARYNLGFTIGGPVVENRDWYFASFEYVSEDRESLFPQDIPSALDTGGAGGFHSATGAPRPATVWQVHQASWCAAPTQRGRELGDARPAKPAAEWQRASQRRPRYRRHDLSDERQADKPAVVACIVRGSVWSPRSVVRRSGFDGGVTWLLGHLPGYGAVLSVRAADWQRAKPRPAVLHRARVADMVCWKRAHPQGWSGVHPDNGRRRE